MRFHLCFILSVLTAILSIIHKLIHKEKQYLRDLDTIETVCALTISPAPHNTQPCA